MQHTPRVLAVLACMSAAPAALACRYTVRDVGFVDFGGEPFRLCWVATGHEGAPQAALREIAAGVLYGSNVEYQVVTETTHPAMAAVGVNAGPALVLISPMGGASHVLAQPGEIPDDRDELWELIESIVSCPVRERVLETAIETFCTVLLVEGANVEDNKLARRTIDRSIRRLHNVAGQLPRSIGDGPVLKVISAADRSTEGVLLWGLGINTQRDDRAHVAVLYGRGRRMGPLLSGLDITANEILRRLTLIGQSCECELDRKWIRGTALPVRWSAQRDREVYEKLGFDPASPFVQAEINRIMARGPNSRATAAPPERSIEEMLFGYSEEVISDNDQSTAVSLEKDDLDAQPETVVSAAAPEVQADPALSDIAGDRTQSVAAPATRGLIYALGAVFALSALGGLAVLLRARRGAL